MVKKNKFIKRKETDRVYWVYKDKKNYGEHLFTFDKKKIYNLFSDYPYKLSPEQKKIFDEDNPYWADFFKHRSEDNYDSQE